VSHGEHILDPKLTEPGISILEDVLVKLPRQMIVSRSAQSDRYSYQSRPGGTKTQWDLDRNPALW
jgi:hypothetical protein